MTARGAPTATVVPGSHEQLAEDAGFEDLDLDRPLLGLHDGDHLAALHRVAGMLQPLDERPGFHIRPQRGHAELAHARAERGLGGSDDRLTWGSAACSR